jgi:gliding motility-associated-like protein
MNSLENLSRPILIFGFLLLLTNKLFSQSSVTNKIINSKAPMLLIGDAANMKSVAEGIFNSKRKYINNVGQYGKYLPKYKYMGDILYGYEGLKMPILFTKKGLIFLHGKSTKTKKKDLEPLMQKNTKHEEAEIESESKCITKTITMELVNGNSNPTIITEGLAEGYNTYGTINDKAYGYKKIIYQEIYPGIDIIFSFNNNTASGFEYSYVIRPLADISLIKMQYKGDVKNIVTSKNLITINSDIEGIAQTFPVCYYDDNHTEKIKSTFSIVGKTIGFKILEKYDKLKTLIIDPFVTSTSTLAGFTSDIASDIDFDYNGNIYVTGGDASGFTQKIAKFNENGIVQWIFSGSISLPFWQFGGSYGGWVVEKSTGKIYAGQGLSTGGFSVVRLNNLGIYDNYITTVNANFEENWKMIWNCNGGSPKILIAGGGGNANNELAILDPSTILPIATNISGLSGGHNDISDMVIDPITNDMYTIFSTGVNNIGQDCKLYKHKVPYTAANNLWSAFSGFSALREPYNRPYLGGLNNASNTIAVNSQYLFYWDGKNLKAFNKLNGSPAGTPITTPGNTILLQGGVFADECNNVFVGSINGTIKVYKFINNVFDDAAANDLTVTGFLSNAIYDLAYDNGKNRLYACGKGFVASFDLAQYCSTTIYTVSVVTDNVNLSATCALSPTPPTGSTLHFSLFNGTTLITTNTTGIFTALTTGVTYTVKAYINEACGGLECTKNFIIPCATTAYSVSVNSDITGLSATATLFPTPPTNTTLNYLLYAGTALITSNTTGVFTGLTLNINYTIKVLITQPCGNTEAIKDFKLNCPSPPTFTLSISENIASLSATATILPLPSNTASVTYSLFNDLTFITSNNTGIFTGLLRGVKYTIKVLVNVDCGSTQASKEFIFANTPSNIIIGFHVPNSFTPNADGKNDFLKALVTGMEFHYFNIYNRFGELVFSTHNAAIGWDGNINGKKQNTGSYVWIAEVVNQFGRVVTYKGSSVLIR